MSTESSIGYGSKFQIDPTGGGSYTTISQVDDITPPAPKQTSVMISHNLSDNRHHEYRAGMIDGGEAKFKMVFSKAQFATILGYMQTGSTYAWKQIFSDNATESSCSRWKFNAFVLDMSQAVPLDDRVTAEVTLKITGKPSFSVDAASE